MGRVKTRRKEMTEYAKWKMVLWRYIRVFMAAFIVQLAVTLPKLDVTTLTLETAIQFCLLPCAIAGISAIGKALRVYLEEGYPKVDKLPL